MKTIAGKPTSEKPISLSKAAKYLSKFISAENGASHVINAYLHRASSSFNELNQLHKELRLPHSDQKHKRSTSKTHDDKKKIKENYIQSAEINEEPNNWAVHQLSSKNSCKDAGKSLTVEDDAGTEGGCEMHKKKKKKHDIKLQEQGDHRVNFEVQADHKLPLTEVVNENGEKMNLGGLDFNQEPVEREKRKKKKHEDEFSKHVVAQVKVEEGSNEENAGGGNEGLDEGKNYKKEKEKKKNKDKDTMNNSYDKEVEVIKLEDEIASRKGDHKQILGNGVENKNGDFLDLKGLPNKRKKRHMAGSDDKLNTDELKKVHKKRKNEDVEGREDDKSGEPTKKKIKKEHGGDD